MKSSEIIIWYIFSIIWVGLLFSSLAGCKALQKIIPSAAQVAPTGRLTLPQYFGPKARITIADFEIKTAKVTGQFGSDLRQMLLNTLINSNRFSVVERQAASADLIITACVSEFEPQASGGRGGIGGGGGVSSGILGGLLGPAPNKAYMALDIRIVDVSTSKILAATKVKSQASDIDKAMRTCIIEAGRYISEGIPARFYKY